MNKYLLLIFTLFSIVQYGQSLSKTSILYESKDLVVMNNGKSYQILDEKPFFEISDTTIEKYIQIEDHLLRLNRIMMLRNENEYSELIEWLKDDFKFYKSRVIIDYDNKGNNVSDSNTLTID
ncbi:hypothetical protein [Aquimarina sp. 2304DJ70-9]|uniref:hypothetical protein n=1 Tax=Aquimarina penaris TaxID=3231044 RepID=UPI003462C757